MGHTHSPSAADGLCFHSLSSQKMWGENYERIVPQLSFGKKLIRAGFHENFCECPSGTAGFQWRAKGIRTQARALCASVRRLREYGSKRVRLREFGFVGHQDPREAQRDAVP